MTAQQPKRGGAGRGQGRKPAYPDAVLVPVTVKMTARQKEKLQELGGAPWVRERIDKAELPTK